jgi:hypothetical protein
VRGCSAKALISIGCSRKKQAKIQKKTLEIIQKECFLKVESMASCGMRVATAVPGDNARVVAALRELP